MKCMADKEDLLIEMLSLIAEQEAYLRGEIPNERNAEYERRATRLSELFALFPLEQD